MTTTGGSPAKVYTTDGTESYVQDRVETEIRSELNYYYKKSDVDARLEALTTTGDVATNKNNINDLKIKAESTGATLTDLSGRMTVAESDIGTLKGEMSTAKSDIGTLKTKDTELDQKIDKEIQDRKNDIKATNDRTGGIARNLEGTQTTIEGSVKVDN